MPQKVDAVARKSDDANKNHSNVRREDTSTVLPESGRAGGALDWWELSISGNKGWSKIWGWDFPIL